MTKLVFRSIVSGADLKAALQASRAAEAVADAIVADLEQLPTAFGLDMDLRHLAGQVKRQSALPRDGARDGRFLLNLEHALRNLAVRAPVLTGEPS